MEPPTDREIEEVENLNRALGDRVVKRLLDQIAEKDETIAALYRWIVWLIGICFVLLIAPNVLAAIKLGICLGAGWVVLSGVLWLVRRKPR